MLCFLLWLCEAARSHLEFVKQCGCSCDFQSGEPFAPELLGCRFMLSVLRHFVMQAAIRADISLLQVHVVSLAPCLLLLYVGIGM